jgi:hypothetical protein
MAEKIDQADMQRSWSKIKSGEKRKPRQTSQVQTATPVLPIRQLASMPLPTALATLTHAQRQAFKRMALHPDDVLKLSQLKCISDTADKLVAVGLAERVGHGWRCTVAGQELKDVLTWFQLYHVDAKCLMYLGVVKARRPGGPKYYVTCTNHKSLPNTLWVLPVDGFPRVNSIPLHAERAQQEGWELTHASDADQAALRAQGFFTGEASPRANLPSERQVTATTIIEPEAKSESVRPKSDMAVLAERFAQADAGMWAAAHALAKGVEHQPLAPEPEVSPEPVELKVYEPDPVPDVLSEVELPEFDDTLLAKMFANLAAHGMTLQDLAG